MLSLFRLVLIKFMLENPHIIPMWTGSKKIKAIQCFFVEQTSFSALLWEVKK